MKKIILIGATLIVLGLLAAWTIPVLAHGLDSGTTATTDDSAWEDMYTACQSGDWEAMGQAAEQVHGEDYDNMPYHEEYSGNADNNGGTYGESWNEMGNHMGVSMMGGGMMGW